MVLNLRHNCVPTKRNSKKQREFSVTLSKEESVGKQLVSIQQLTAAAGRRDGALVLAS